VKNKLIRITVTMISMLFISCGSEESKPASTQQSISKVFNFGEDGTYYGYDTDGVAVASIPNSSETILYIADDYNGLVILDISINSAIIQVGHLETINAVDLKLSADGTKIFLADMTGGLKVIDVSDPSNPTLLKTFNLGTVEYVKLNNDNTRIYTNTNLIDYNPVTDSIMYSTSSGVSKGSSFTHDDTRVYFFSSDTAPTGGLSGGPYGGLDITDLNNTSYFSQTFLNYAKLSVITSDDSTIYFYNVYKNSIYSKNTPSSSSPNVVFMDWAPAGSYGTEDFRLSEDSLSLLLVSKNTFMMFDLRPTTPILKHTLNTGIHLYHTIPNSSSTKAYTSAGVNGIIILDESRIPSE